jgi:ATP-dependent exoDNAse (exonuclease V) alpha subunit
MPVIVDNIEIDEANPEFNYAADVVNNTNNMIFLTGKAGTGKTIFLKYIRQITKKKTVVLAPTGVAALNAGGQTLHSFFKIPPSLYVPDDFRLRTDSGNDDEDGTTIFDNFHYRKPHKNLLLGMELLIIDEVSMVRCDLIDVIDKLLRVFRNKESEPFGGVQVIFIGDLFQLPPITQNDQWDILRNYYETPYFFSSVALRDKLPVYIELKKIYRQTDSEFIGLLNKVRTNQISDNDMTLLNSRFIPSIIKNDNLNYIILATHNRIVDDTNQRKLNDLTTELKVYKADSSGTFPDAIIPTEFELNLKVGAQIMFIKNDMKKKYYNGKIAKIKKLEDNIITVELPDNEEIEVEKFTWNNIKYSWNAKERKIDEEIIGTFTQFPVKLAWAITVHKSQGLTFENVIADLSGAFSPGQVYVALSRCTSFEGLVLKSKIYRNVIKTDPQVIKFAENETHIFD